MAFKDHYKTLGVSSKSSHEEIKKAFRTLAHKYHPDKNPDTSYAQAQFRTIQEAYEVLSNPTTRKLFDEERYFRGLTAQKEPYHIDSLWLKEQAKKLRIHMSRLDSYSMNHRALHEYVLILLSDDHIGILQTENDDRAIRELVSDVLVSIRHLHYSLYPAINRRLSIIASNDPELLQAISQAERERRVKNSQQWIMPLLIIVITLMLCIFMYIYSRRN